MESPMGWRIRNPRHHGIYFHPTVAKKLLCYLIFIVLETLIILGSVVVVFCLYIPFVVVKGIVMTVTGKATPKVRNEAPVTSPNG